MSRYPKGSTGNVKRPTEAEASKVANILAQLPSVPAMKPMTDYVVRNGDGAKLLANTIDCLSATADSFDNQDTETMTIKFTSVTFHHEMTRLAPLNGVATQSTVHFDTTKVKNLVIEFNPATQLVRMAIGTSTRHVPASEVLCFGPTVEEAETAADALKLLRATQAADNARAQAEADELAQRPATA